MVNISHIQARSYVDGPGLRTALFLQGCDLACPGCQNKALWEPKNGKVVPVSDLAKILATLAEHHGNITISGGEPFAQAKALAELVTALRGFPEVKNILVYSGYTWDQINSGLSGQWLWAQTVLDQIDILVDGPFIQNQDDNLLTFRGSRNQRPIDVRASRKSGELVLLDWDSPEISISEDGSLFMPIGLAPVFEPLGAVNSTRRCGQTTGGLK